MLRSFDPVEGGFGGAPKFPQPMNLDFLLQRYVQSKDAALLHAVTFTLTKMARGGMYDQLGGGFHRYSTDDEWLTPHFEKMLYDNAQLARTYLHAWQVTGEPLFRQIAEETLDYVLREMTSPEGGFYSTQDADSEGEEGKFFLWRQAEINALLGPEDGKLFSGYFGVTARGNFHEAGGAHSILHVRREPDLVADDLGVTPDRLAEAIGRRAKDPLRGTRTPHPSRPRRQGARRVERADAARVRGGGRSPGTAGLCDRRATQRRVPADCHATADGEARCASIARTKDGRAHLNAYLEDYAAVALGMLALYQVTFELRWLRTAIDLAQTILDRFHDPAAGGFFQTAADHEQLVARRKDFVDSAIPAGNSLAADLLLRLARLLDRPELADHAAGSLALMAEAMGEQPLAFGRLLAALDFYVNPGFEIAIIGDPAGDDTRALLAEVYRRFMPNTVLAAGAPGDEAIGEVPLLAGREMRGGRPTAYVCRNYACNLPVTEPEALGRQLQVS